MKKALKVVLASSMILGLCACGSKKGNDVITGTYSVHIEGDDWGCGTNKAIVSLDYQLDAVTKDDFTVTETKQITNFAKEGFPVEEATLDRQITDAYLCDENGNKVDGPSKYVAIEMMISPNDGSPVLFSMATMYNTWSDPYYLTISTSETAKLTSDGKEVTSFTVDTALTGKTTSADMFKTDSFEATDGVKLPYAYYEPEQKADTLFVWLHGAGEGGTDHTDPSMILLANEAANFAKEEFQTKIGGAYVLAPQTPSFWMDVDGSGKMGDVDGTSFYTQSLTELIDSYKDKTGATKVVISGCSNGGYMTMVMALAHGDKYTAYVPICEALPDAKITDDQINALAKLPMYFIYSLDDTTVDPTVHENPTIDRLMAAGAKNVHKSTTDHVYDTTGRFTNPDGSQYTYMGHWSWITFDNNESVCNDCKVAAWDWIAEQVK